MILQGNALRIPLKDASVHCVITSPPYWGLRNYSVDGQLGLEKTPEEYVAKMVIVFREVKRVLRDDGTLWLNMGDSYIAGKTGSVSDRCIGLGGGRATQHEAAKRPDKFAVGLKIKDLCGIPWRLAFVLQADGWYLRSDIIWSKANPMPESVTDRPTKAHEYIFLLTKSPHYFFDQEAVRERSVTGDLRRPYGSLGAWELDGRPPEQRHDGELRSHKPGPNSRMFKSQDPDHEREWSGKHRKVDAQTAGRRILLSEKEKRDAGMPHDQPFGIFRNLRSVWSIATQPFSGAHFATFPEELVRKCMFAGTSEKGCCPKCSTPWVRVVDSKFIQEGPTRNRGAWKIGDKDAKSMTMGDGGKVGHNETKTLGWRPSCKCEAGDPVPCVVLDPFGGAGTTLLVATKFRRKCVSLDIKMEYLRMTERRLRGVEVQLF